MFIPLHVKSDYSLGYGTSSVDEMVEAAAWFGYPSLALTDLENLYGQVRFHARCRARGIRAITGIELRPGFDGRREFGSRKGRIVLLAADLEGYRNLCRIVSRRRGAAGKRAGGGSPGKDPASSISRMDQGLYALTDAPSVAEKLISVGFPKERMALLLIRPDDQGSEKALARASRRLGLRMAADMDAVFLHESEHPLHILQVAVRQVRRVADVSRQGPAETRERWLRSPEEAAALYADIPETLKASEEIADSCRLDLSSGFTEFPSVDCLSEESARDRLRGICREAVLKRTSTGAWGDGYENRLQEELSAFEALGLSGLLLIIAEVASHCAEEGIPVAVRGSAVSSLVLHLLGISPVDPVENGLIFERFLHSGKSHWPDVDLDLPWHRRDEVIEWVYERFGRDRVAMVAAHHTFQRRSALRKGLKAWGADRTLIDKLSRNLPPEDLNVEEVDFLDLAEGPVDRLAESAVLGDGSPQTALGEALRLVQRLIGRPHHVAAHPGGVVIGREPLEERLPLERAPKGVVITQYDLTSLAELGVMKIDFLGNRSLSELEETLRLAGDPDPSRLEKIPEDDPAALALIDRAATVGCFQLESPAMRSLLVGIPIRSQSDVVAALALIRPGAAAGEAKSEFIRRARTGEVGEPLDPIMADRLAETHGMLLYEEDIMVMLSRLGGMTLGEADELRSAIVNSGGDPEVLTSLETGFLERAGTVLGRGPESSARARRAWEAAARFAAYSFNKAHAVSYARLAYFTAYMKVHHLLEFACALLNHYQGFYPLRTVAGEFARLGADLRGPQVNRSELASTVGDYQTRKRANFVRVGLDKIKVLSLRSAASLIDAREEDGPFSSFRQLVERVHLPFRELAALVWSGACDGLAPLSAGEYPFVHEAALDLLKRGSSPEVLDGIRLRDRAETPGDRKRLHLYQSLVRIRNELRYLQMHLSGHPAALLRAEAARYGCIPIREASGSSAGSGFRLAALVSALRRVPTSRGPMQFLTLEDETGLLEAALLPPAYQVLGERVTTPGPFLVDGRLRRRQGAAYLEVSGLAPFYQRERPYGHFAGD